MRFRIRRPAAALAGVGAVGLFFAPSAMADAEERSYEVTIENLTSGQPLTPPVAATHRGKNLVFKVGHAASFGIQQIAENGNNAPLLDDLGDSSRVSDVDEGPGGPLVPPNTPGSASFDATTTFTLTADEGARRISFAAMLICTNDGFTGVNGLKLPREVGDGVSRTTAGYDAGTELNTEDFADIVPPCQDLIGVTSSDDGTNMTNPALAEGGVIAHHPNIAGGVDLVPGIHGWTDPVARITVERTS